jgi:hypothetical protein
VPRDAGLLPGDEHSWLAGGRGNLEFAGQAGGTLWGGLSGYGGAGGAPGAAGGTQSFSGGAGGDAGAAIRVEASVTLTKEVAGTIDGAEVAI